MTHELLEQRIEGYFLLRCDLAMYGSGRPAFQKKSFSLHRSMREYYAFRKPGRLFSSREPYLVIVSPSLYERVCSSKNGIVLDWKETEDALKVEVVR